MKIELMAPEELEHELAICKDILAALEHAEREQEEYENAVAFENQAEGQDEH